jgi:formylglycine-generating enzyme required for sulfatase activity
VVKIKFFHSRRKKMKKMSRTMGLQTMFAAAVFGVVLTAISCQASLSDAAGTDGQTARSLALPSHSASVGNIEEWSLIDFGGYDTMQSVAFGDYQAGVFVAGAGRDAYSGKLVYSTNNGVSWTTATTNGGLENINAIAYGTTTASPNGVFVAVGDSTHSPYNKIAYSIDGGVNWIGASAEDLGINDGDYFRSVAYGEDIYGNGVFVAGGGVDYPSVQNVLYTSNPTNLKSWQHSATAETIFASVDCQAISYDGKVTWVALGGNGGLTFVYASAYSVDGGVTWSPAGADMFCKGIAYDDDHDCFIGSGQFGRITVSQTGQDSWTDVQMNGWEYDYANFINCVAHGNGFSVVVGEGKLAYTTLSPISANNWILLTAANGEIPVRGYMNAIAFGNNTFVTVGDSALGMRAAATVVPSYTVSGTVTDGGIPVSGADVTIDASFVAAATTDTHGDYTLTGVRDGSYTVIATNGTDSGSVTVTVNGANVSGVNIELSPPLPPLPNMVSLVGGSFTMGSTDFPTDATPLHTVTLAPFYMNKYEVTQAEFLALMGFNPSQEGTTTACPVETVTWYDAAAYCNELSLQQNRSPAYTITDVVKTGNSITSATVVWNTEYTGYRLPTEAEWEYAVRGGTTSAYFWGATDDDAGIYTWYSANTETTQPVGTKAANPFGLYDMTGNVWEWCWDWYSETYYSSSPAQDPQGPVTGTTRVQRGGSWITMSWMTYAFESGYRDTHEPGELETPEPGDPSSVLGFRVVLPNSSNK